MRSTIAVHLAVTFESPGGAPPTREGDDAGSTKGNNLPPIQRPDDLPPLVIDVPPGTRPRIDLFVTIGSEPEGAAKVDASPSEAPTTSPNPSESPSSGPRRREEAKLVGPRRKKS